MFSPCMSKTSKKVSTGLRQRTFTFFTLFPRDLRSGNFYRRLIQAVGERNDWVAGNPGAEAPKCHQVAGLHGWLWSWVYSRRGKPSAGLQVMQYMGYQGVMGS